MLGDRACGLGGAGHGGLGVVWPVGDGASWVAPFRAVAGGACGLCPESRAGRARAPRLPRFILVVSFSDTYGLNFKHSL